MTYTNGEGGYPSWEQGRAGGNGGFGGGGGGGGTSADESLLAGGNSGNGGFGGGGGGAPDGFYSGINGQGGFGGGDGATTGKAAGGGGGGGLGAGGDIFIQQGGTLIIAGGTLSGSSVTAGQGANGGSSGQAYGSGIFLHGDQTITLSPGAGQTLTVGDVIADMTGSSDPSGQTGTGAVRLTGPGTVVLGAANTYTGGTDVSAGTLAISNAGAIGSGGLTLENGTTLAALDSFTLNQSVIVSGDPTFDVASGDTLTVTGTIADGTTPGNVVVQGGGEVILAASNGYSGGTTIEANATLALEAVGAAGSGGIVFDTGDETLVLDQTDLAGNTLPNTITGFNAGDTIDIANLALADGATANFAGGTLTVSSGAVVDTFLFAGDYTGAYFHLAATGETGFAITVDGTPCYCRGTLILTDRGEVPVEDLRIGDRLVTRDGSARPLRWVGRRSYAGRFLLGNRPTLPIRFAAGSLGEGLPRRDLYVSPLHAMYLDGVLVPAFVLVNGVSIVQVERMAEVSYFHLELETHDVIIAEGAASESFVDDDSRGMFHNAAEFAALYPEAPRESARFCAPRHEDGPVVEAIRRRLLSQATRAAANWSAGGFACARP